MILRFKFDRNSKATNFFGKIQLKTIVEWLKKKVGLSSKPLKVNSKDDLERKTRGIDHLVVYIGDLKAPRFIDYQEVAKDFIQQDDIEFVHVESSTPLDVFENLPKDKGWNVRVYRQRNTRNFKDY